MAKKNLFAAAKVTETDKPKRAKGKVKVDLDENLDYYAAIDALKKSLDTVASTVRQEVLDQMKEHFVEEAVETGKRPTNFEGEANVASASCELRLRASNMKLKDEEVELLKKYEIPVETKGEVKYFFNPEIMKNKKLIDKISDKLLEIPELKNMDVIMVQPVDSIVAETALDAVAQLGDKVLVEQLLTVVGTLAIKPKLKTQDLDTILSLVKKAGVKIA